MDEMDERMCVEIIKLIIKNYGLSEEEGNILFTFSNLTIKLNSATNSEEINDLKQKLFDLTSKHGKFINEKIMLKVSN